MNSQTFANYATVFSAALSLIAILISIKSCSDGQRAISIADEANGISNDANLLAKQALDRDIYKDKKESGDVPALLNVVQRESDVNLFTLDDLEDASLGVMVTNVGKEPIDMVRVQVFTSMMWKEHHRIPTDSNREGFHQQVDRVFTQHVRPGGMAKVDLTKELLQQMLKLDFGSEGETYSVMFNVVCTGRLVGNDLPTGVGLDEEITPEMKSSFGDVEDRQIIVIEWKPGQLARSDIEQFLTEYRSSPWISN